ncbi:MAG: geranylgeranyl reductase family protein [Bacteroidetes bacterium]|nr:geranylgeranyl reductase family protein [Bacteroidota bacterium]
MKFGVSLPDMLEHIRTPDLSGTIIMSANSFDLIIVGAGPAGLTTALFMRDSGLNIALVDKASLPGEKICGDALSGSVMSVLKRMPGDIYRKFLDLPDKSPSNGIRFYAPDHHFLDVPFVLNRRTDSPAPGYICKRRDFDRFLFENLEQGLGITIFSGFKVAYAEADENGVTISDGSNELKAKMVVGADGIHSVIGTKLAGNQMDHRNDSLGVRAYFSNVKDLHPYNFIELHFFRKLLPGYFWIFPMQNNEANVGLGMMVHQVKKGRVNLSGLLLDIIKYEPGIRNRFSDATMTGKIEAHALPLGPPRISLSGTRFLLAGDAAFLVDPFSGEGIGNAMLSGEIASQVIREAFQLNDFSSAFLRKYDLLIKQKMLNGLRISYNIQRLATSPWLFNFIIKKAGKDEESAKMFSEMYTRDESKKQLMNPLFYMRFLFG